MPRKSKSGRNPSFRTRFSARHQPKRYGGGAHRKGSENFAAKLTEAQVKIARRLYKEGKEIKVIAERFGVSPSTMSLAVRRKTFRHVR
ncbi:MAG: helix-turn-helix domain-containing protein [Gemmatimonadales bacterium]